jgi:hypothetical protein
MRAHRPTSGSIIKLSKKQGNNIKTIVVDLQWFQLGSGSSFLSQWSQTTKPMRINADPDPGRTLLSQNVEI